MSSTSYTEFNADMFLCNNFDNKSGVYYKDSSTVLSTPSNLHNATFYNLTDLKIALKNPSTLLKQHHIDSLETIINPNKPEIPYDISSVLYSHLEKNKKSYDEFQKSYNPNDDWIYTFGQLVYSNIKTTTDTNVKKEVITYSPTYT